MSLFDGYGNVIVIGGASSEGKHYNTFSVLSDSFSAYDGYVEPSDNAYYFPTDNNDITDVTEMWWHLFARSYGSVLQRNNAFSGSRIVNDADWYAGIEKSFIGRANDIGKPELIFVMGGTNDVWNSIAIGEYVYSDWTDEQLQQFRPGVAYLIDYLMKHNAGAKIVFLISTGTIAKTTEYYTSIKTICEHYGVDALDFNVTMSGNHPTVHGMNQIRNAIMDYLDCEPSIVKEITVTDATFPKTATWSPEKNKWTLSEPLISGKRYRIEIEVSKYSSDSAYLYVQTNGSPAGILADFSDSKGILKLSKVIEAQYYANGVASIGVCCKGDSSETAVIESFKIYEVSYDM